MKKEELSEDGEELLEQIADLDDVYAVRPLEELGVLSADKDVLTGHKGLRLDVYLED